ncbi:hypothetical protein AB0K89_23795 [Streptomyces cinnamoneus]|uniref:hypothetical protein n=1 Tax=Streptomyces cinnamoneus TaxID=53446 RepID=UPI00342F0174
MSPRSYFPGRGTLIEQTWLEGKAEGRAEERAQMVLRVLDNRGIPTLPVTRERITSCTDLHTLARWIDRAFTVSDAEELFVDED